MLFTVIGTTYGSGDGSSTFNVPDLLGEFMRGCDDSCGIDRGLTLGSTHADEVKSYMHPYTESVHDIAGSLTDAADDGSDKGNRFVSRSTSATACT